jgi:hypothetical protein
MMYDKRPAMAPTFCPQVSVEKNLRSLEVALSIFSDLSMSGEGYMQSDPPSTVMAWPLMKDDESEASRSARAVRSAGWPSRFTAVP